VASPLPELDKFFKDLEDVARNDTLLREIAKYIETQIKKRTRLGKGVPSQGAAAEPLKKLSNEYKLQRRELKKQGLLSGDTTPAKTNLTKTGSMLDNIIAEVRNSSIVVDIKGTDKFRMSNRKKAELVSKERPFMNLSKAELREVDRIIRKFIEALR